MTLYGGPISPFVRKVDICILEKRLGSQVRRVGSRPAPVQANTELLHYNPLSKVPTLVTADGMTLFDSDVICEYLDAAFSPATLLPAMGMAHWSALRWNALGSGALDALVLWRFERNRPVAQQLPEVLTTFGIKTRAVLATFEVEISDLEAQPFGIGHIAIGCTLGYLDFRFPELDWRGNHPRCAAWFQKFMLRPSAMQTVPYEGTAPANHVWLRA